MGLKHKIRSFRRDLKGSTAIMFAIAFPAVIGGFILMTEVGFWFHTKANIQNTADMAAIAGAREYVVAADIPSSKIAVVADAQDNFFDSSKGDLDAYIPPISGAYTGEAAVQVQIEQEVSTFFIHMFRDDPIITKVNAVARILTETADACVVSLSTSGTGISIGGNAGVVLDGCMLHSNSVSPAAINAFGSSVLTAGCVATSGETTLTSGGVTLEDCSAPWENVDPIADPFSHLTAPDLSTETCGGATVTGNGNNRQTHVPSPSTPGGLVCFDEDVTFYGDVELDPGVYVFDGEDVDFHSGATLSGEDVTIIFMNDADFGGLTNSNQLDISAPTSGDYAGVAIYGDRDTMGSDSWTFAGQALVSIEGAVYTPTIDMTYVGGSGAQATACTQLVANTVTFTGNSGFQSNCDPWGLGSIEVTGYSDQVALVE